MANNLNGPVHELDTVGVVTTNDTTIRYIRWFAKAAVAGDEVILHDASARVIWRSVASGANYIESDYPNLPCKGGYVINTLAANTKLYIIVS